MGILFVVNECHLGSCSSAETRVCSCAIRNVSRFIGKYDQFHWSSILRPQYLSLFITYDVQCAEHCSERYVYIVHSNAECCNRFMKRNPNAQLPGMYRCTVYLVCSVHFHLSKFIIIHLLVLNMEEDGELITHLNYRLDAMFITALNHLWNTEIDYRSIDSRDSISISRRRRRTMLMLNAKTKQNKLWQLDKKKVSNLK